MSDFVDDEDDIRIYGHYVLDLSEDKGVERLPYFVYGTKVGYKAVLYEPNLTKKNNISKQQLYKVLKSYTTIVVGRTELSSPHLNFYHVKPVEEVSHKVRHRNAERPSRPCSVVYGTKRKDPRRTVPDRIRRGGMRFSKFCSNVRAGYGVIFVLYLSPIVKSFTIVE